ncbi:MAG: C25 family cysteine peptidase [Candidatus Krumholzibacteriota bacterium]
MSGTDSRSLIRVMLCLLAMASLVPGGVLAAGDSTGNAGGQFKVLSSGPEALRFSFGNLEPVWIPRTVGDPAVTLYDVSMDGFISSGEPGHPRVPRTGGWVVVPPGTRPEVKPLKEQWEPAGDRPLMVEAVPVIIPGGEPWESSASEIFVMPGEEPPADARIPAAAVEALARRGQIPPAGAVTLGEVVWWRGRRIVSYQVTPIRQDAAGRAGRYLASGSWEIRFVPDSSAGRAIAGAQARKISNRNDDRFGEIFLNRELLTQLPVEATWQGVDFSAEQDAENSALKNSRGGKAGTLLGPETRLAMWKTGLVRLTFDRLRSRGHLPEGVIREDQIRLFQRRYDASLDDGTGQAPYVEIEVPLHMVGEGDDFDGDDYFVFYGLRSRDDLAYEADLGNGTVTISGAGDEFEMNNQGNVYWLAASEPEAGTPWARMATTTLPAAAGTPLANYRRDDHVEENLAFRENPPAGNVDRLYFNTYRTFDISAGLDPLWAPDPAGADVDIKLAIAGYNDVPHTLGIDLVTNSILTTHLENYYISRIEEVQRSYRVPAAAIDGDFAEIHIYRSPTGPFNVYSFLNWVEISYDALYQATGDRITFNAGMGVGPQPIEVTGFTSADIGLVEVTDPRNPVFVELAGGNITTTDSVTWTLSVMPDQSGATRIFAAVGDFSTSGVDEYNYLLPTIAEDPTNPTTLAGSDPDLVVIAHPEFIPALDRWVEHRKSRAGGNLDVHVVDVDDLYDWYSGGMRDPWALKRFVTHAITQWNSWALTVVGDANENSLEKGVVASARGWSKDWVPTHYHSQTALAFTPELMASDKWYTTLESGQNYPLDNFPWDVLAPWEMYTGRLPCNSVAELDIMIDKIMTVDNVAADQAWRRRGIFFADDQWSNGYGANSSDELIYKWNETVFADSERDSLSRMWSSGSPVALDSILVLLEDTLDPVMPPYEGSTPDPRDLSYTQSMASAASTPVLIGKLSQGGLVAHYQGHANPYVLSSEYWLQDKNDVVSRLDVAKLGNTDKPWFFMGMGCHIADWAQNTVLATTQPHERSISEKFLIKPRSGASAAYGSSGYEYISTNRLFGEYIFRRWMVNPPAQRSVGNSQNLRSRWVTGELMWAAEADIYAANRGSTVQEMISQYVLLGDPLMGLDAGEPQVTAFLIDPVDQEIVDGAEIFALDNTNLRTVRLFARDEAGIDRVQVVDSRGEDLTGGMVITETLPAGVTNHQSVQLDLSVPVRPFAHDLIVKVYDTGGALESDRHYELLLHLPQTAEFSLDGSVVDPATFVFPAETPLRFRAEVTSAAWMLGYDPAVDFELRSVGETLAIAPDVDFQLNKNQHLTVNFTATAAVENPDDQHVVELLIKGYPTELVLQQGTGAATSMTISKVYNFPNPMRESTRFVFESGLAANEGTIRVFSVAGRPVARIPFVFSGGGSGVVEWNGRDSAGDDMGNGTYLYRVEIETNNGLVVSDMQRLVMMR